MEGGDERQAGEEPQPAEPRHFYSFSNSIAPKPIKNISDFRFERLKKKGGEFLVVFSRLFADDFAPTPMS